jgi:hypothetical protein
MESMAREKVTITLDRSKAEAARALIGASSTSATVDVALDRLIRAEQLRNDISAYLRLPPTDAEIEAGLLAENTPLDDTDWEALYNQDNG